VEVMMGFFPILPYDLEIDVEVMMGFARILPHDLEFDVKMMMGIVRIPPHDFEGGVGREGRLVRARTDDQEIGVAARLWPVPVPPSHLGWGRRNGGVKETGAGFWGERGVRSGEETVAGFDRNRGAAPETRGNRAQTRAHYDGAEFHDHP
jgi:hypothetical protein